MIYPVIAYGDPVLKRPAEPVAKEHPELQKLIDDMFETMYNANGVGIAAPQIGKSIRLFIVDGSAFEDEPDMENFKQTYINPQLLEADGEPWAYEEGCLSIPNVRQDVNRPERIRIKYFDRDWKAQEDVLEGLKARIVQHEFDHIEGILFTDHLTTFKKRLLKGKLSNISKGKVDVDYKMKFPASGR